MDKLLNSQMEQNKRTALKIWDGAENSREEKKETGGWNGFHVLFTEKTQFLIIWESIQKKLIKIFLGVLAFLALFIICLGGDILFLPKAVLISAVVVVIYGLYCRDDVYTNVFDPSRDQGMLCLPEGMTWETAVDIIRRGFAEAAVEQITDTTDTVVFHSQKYGVYQIQNTENGLALSILNTPSKKEERKPRYFLFGNMIYSQVIALLYPQLLSAIQVEQEKNAVHKYMKQKNMAKLLGIVAFVIFAAVAAFWYFNMDSVKSCGISDCKLDIFSADATLSDIFDAYFDASEWDHYEQDGQTIVTYSGDKNLNDGTTARFTFYFLLNTDDTFNLDRIASNGYELDWLQVAFVLNALDENYIDEGNAVSEDITMLPENGESVPDGSSWNNSDQGYSANDDFGPSDVEWGPSAGQVQLLNEVYGTVWPSWINEYNPVSPKYDDISYGMVMDVLLDDGGNWYFDEQNGSVNLEGTYITFDYTMGMADEPTPCEVYLSFTMDDLGNWIVSDFRGDEFNTAEDFLAEAYSYYYQSYCY